MAIPQQKIVGAAVDASASGAWNVDWPMVFLALSAGLGLSISGAQFVGGMCLALTGALVAWKMPGSGNDPRRLWVVIASGFLVAYFAALLHPSLIAWAVAKFDFPNIPPQASMITAGFGSKWFVKFAYDFFERIGARGKDVADRVVPPEDNS